MTINSLLNSCVLLLLYSYSIHNKYSLRENKISLFNKTKMMFVHVLFALIAIAISNQLLTDASAHPDFNLPCKSA